MKFSYQPRRADINYCWKVSEFRYAVNKELGWASINKNNALIYGFIGALGELAGSVIFGIEWDGAMLKKDDFLKYRKIAADLGPFEIKTVHKEVGNLTIKTTDKDFAHCILMRAPDSYEAALQILKGTTPELPPIEMVGYMKVAEAKKIGDWYPDLYVPDKGRWIVNRKKLHSPEELAKFLEHFDKIRKTISFVKSGKVPPFRLKK